MIARRLAFGLILALWAATADRPARADEAKAADLNSIRLYVPTTELETRVGKDVKPPADYIKALAKAANQRLAKADKPRAKGLLIAVGINAGRRAKVWCQAVEGEVPAALLRKLEKDLGQVRPIALKKAPMAFGLEVKLWGQKPKQYPAFPDVWQQAAKKTKNKLLVPPDELFQVIWPE